MVSNVILFLYVAKTAKLDPFPWKKIKKSKNQKVEVFHL